MPKNLTKPFVIILMILVLFGCYFVFRPFLKEILIAVIMATVFYTPFEWLSRRLRGRRNLAALIMCLLLVLIIIIPALRVLVYAGQKSVAAYSQTVQFFDSHDLNDVFKSDTFQNSIFKNIDLIGFSERNEHIKSVFLNTLKQSSN